jgi:5'-methylthioadenosine phosphorylase
MMGDKMKSEGRPLGIISGTISLDQLDHNNSKKILYETDFGKVSLSVSDEVILIHRHGIDPDNHILPHAINHRANFSAFKQLGVSSVIGVHSTGSLKVALKPGMMVVPDDFICLVNMQSIFTNKAFHITPSLNDTVRHNLLNIIRKNGADVVDGGVYWQMPGPRLETKAEIRLISQFADLVGMTMASEAVAANELDLPFASLCSVDNYANGVVEQQLSHMDINTNARKNQSLIIEILRTYIQDDTKKD